MNKVRATTLPAQSLLHSRVADSDFLDCYTVQSLLAARDAAEILISFPIWARALLHLRNVVAVPLGLSTTGPTAADKVGPFPIETETERELIAGFNDKHLDFRISVMADEGMVFLATWVRPHNIGGRLYLGTVMPFHIAIVRDALHRVADKRNVLQR